MLAQGVYLPPSPFEACFTSVRHGDAELKRWLRASEVALQSLTQESSPWHPSP